MKKYKKNKFFQFLFPFLFIIGIVLIFFGFRDRKIVNLKYKEDNKINYNVYLKPNSFFETPYLGENETYIASLIDYIDIHFHYGIKYDKKFSGNYKYKFVALVSANKKDANGHYWQREYSLTEFKNFDAVNQDFIAIDDNVKVNYGTYNDILNQFRKEYDLTTQGELKVIMKVSSNFQFTEVKEPVVDDSELNLSIPLLEQALELSINKDVSNERDVVSFVESDNSIIYIFFKIFGTLCIIFSIAGFVIATKRAREFRKNNLYTLKLDKILKNYDSIIANVKKLPNINDFKKIEISSFEELLDVYSEVRMPINCYQGRYEALFVIINNETAWVYKLKRSDLSEKSDDYEED
ncbi:MAG: hypothetical protein IKG27_01965 [Bacilli bacterium]|nr:hypothetical protein [Bacilli bacterium]